MALLSEDLIFTRDHDGSYHFYSDELPFRTVIDVHAIAFRWIRVSESGDSVTVTLDGRTVIYDRIGFTPAGHWVCMMRINPASVHVPGG